MVFIDVSAYILIIHMWCSSPQYSYPTHGRPIKILEEGGFRIPNKKFREGGGLKLKKKKNGSMNWIFYIWKNTSKINFVTATKDL